MSGAKLAGVIGWPVHHSLSPLMHSYWLSQLNIAGSYVALPIAPENFGRAIAAMPLMGFAGANVTVPHKEAAFALSATLDEDARETGAVNTLLFREGLIHGRNTDVGGFAQALIESLGKDAASRGPVVVLGAGGAARAVLLALARAGASEVRIVNRTKTRSEALAAKFGQGAKVRLIDWGDWQGAFADACLVVNTTSLGMLGKPPLDISLDHLPGEAAVADIVYNPLETPLLKLARERGARTMDGLGMLMHQAVPAFAAWFGVTPQVTPALRAELVKALPVTDLKGRPFVVGLTGSIGMGKSETGKLFARLGIPVHDSDAAVHALYEPGGAAVDLIAKAFPKAVRDGRVDRAALAVQLAGDEAAFQGLEAIVHPLVQSGEREFLATSAKRGDELVVLDIPLLFETGADRRVDAVVVVSAPADVQRARVLARDGMTLEKLESIHARQVPDVDKRRKADFVIETDKGLAHAFEAVKRVVAELRARAGQRHSSKD